MDYSDVLEQNTPVLNIPEIFQPFLQPAPFKIAHGGRGGAKSETVAQLLVFLGYQSKKKILCAREFQNTLKESSKALIEEMIKRLNLEWFYRSTEEGIKGINGTEFIFKGLKLNVGSLNSLYGIDICWLEEAQYNSRVSIKALLPVIRKKGSEIWATMNPRKKDDIIYEMFIGGTPPEGSIVIQVNYYDNPWFGETSLVAQMEAERIRNPAEYRHVWLGELETRSDAIVFRNWQRGVLTPVPGMMPLYGVDWGFSVSPTVLIKCWIFPEENQLYFEKEVVEYQCPIDRLPLLFDKIPECKFGIITADSARPELIDHMRRLNYRIHPSVKGKNSVIEGVEFLRSFDIVVNENNCPLLIDEMETYSYDLDKEGRILPNLVPGKDHAIDAGRYAIEKDRRAQLKVSVRNFN